MSKADDLVAYVPEIFMRDGLILANSLQIAKDFNKRHEYVLKAIEDMIRLEPDLAGESFQKTTTYNASNGQVFRAYDMDEQGFALVVMGFTGEKAFRVKLAYTRQFKAMKEALLNMSPAPQPVAALNMRDPGQIALAFTQAVEMLQELQIENKSIKQEIAVVSTQLEIAAPKADFFDRHIDDQGLIGLRNAARILGVKSGEFFKRLERDILCREGKVLVPRSTMREKGYFEVKIHFVEERSYPRTFVTVRGLQFLARVFQKLDLLTQLQLR